MSNFKVKKQQENYLLNLEILEYKIFMKCVILYETYLLYKIHFQEMMFGDLLIFF